MACFPAKRTGSQGSQTDGNPCLRDQGKTEIVPDLRRFSCKAATSPCTDIFAQNPNKEIDNTNDEKRHCTDVSGIAEKGAEVEGKPAPEEKQ